MLENIHRRQSTRLHSYNYTQSGAYFITICAWKRECLFGQIEDGVMRLNNAGQIVQNCWIEIPQHYPHIELDQFVIMPNHVHGILFIDDQCATLARATHASPLHIDVPTDIGATHGVPGGGAPAPGPKTGSIGAIVGQFKSAVTRHINRSNNNPGATIWQRNYHDHIIRNEKSLQETREYMVNNPLQWVLDRNHPGNINGGKGDACVAPTD